ncbi:MAG: AAA family ATPase [Burkholderiaceae bacterium]
MATPALTIALLGAESSGKTQLAQALAAHFRKRGQRAVLVPEYLRLWCEQQRRTPRQQEQEAIAREQARQVDEAGPCDVLIADTTALMIAVYSDHVFADTSLYRFALAQQRRYHVTLLTGLDLPWVADGLQREGPHVQQPVDSLLRQALQGAGLAYQVVYGQGQQRLENALNAISAIEKIASQAVNTLASGIYDHNNDAPMPKMAWCERCSQPDCEHRLFTALIAKTSPLR